MIVRKWLFTIAILGHGLFSYAQTYDDVLLLVNSNDSISMSIGAYFQSQRNIPSSHVIAFPMPAQEIITPEQFGTMADVLDSIVTQRNLPDSFAYIVTTKGMPLGISADTDGYYAGVPYSPLNASVESELTILFSPALSSYIGDSFDVLNPYYGKTAPFSPAANMGIRLVTRLDGYTLQDVKDLIDRSGPNRFVRKDSALVVIDRDPVWDSILTDWYVKNVRDSDTLWDDYYDSTVRWLRTDGWTVLYDTTPSYITRQSNVIAYQSWGSNDHSFGGAFNDTSALPDHSWLPGALAVWYVSTSGRSFMPGTPYGQSLAADLVSEGVSGIAAFVFEPFFYAMPNIALTFPNYLLSTRRRNLAEAFYSAMQPLSWMGTVIGDPKTSISTTITAMRPEETTASISIRLYPNPAKDVLYVLGTFSARGGGEIRVLTPTGQVIFRRRWPAGASQIRLPVKNLPPGIYFVRVRSGQHHGIYRFVKQ